MSTSLKNTTVLVVDDDADTCELLRTILEQSGAEVVVAHSVEDAIKAHRTSPAHVLVSDIRLGSSDGYALIREIREYNREYRGFTPAIALTGFTSPGDQERAMAAGFNAYIPKPFDPADLPAKIAGLLGRSPEAAA
jgi:CheY-like chemotaxis protein